MVRPATVAKALVLVALKIGDDTDDEAATPRNARDRLFRGQYSRARPLAHALINTAI